MARRTADGRTFGDIYRQQYREISTSRTSRAFRILTPLAILAAVLLHRPRGAAGSLALLLVAVVLLGISMVLTMAEKRGRRRRES